MKRKPSRHAPNGAAYEVGYCKPPLHSRFKPGESGCPSGRPRGQRNFKTAVREALQEKVAILEGDRQRKLPKMDAIIRVAVNKALKGDAKGLMAIVQLIRWVGLMDEEPELASTESISAEDEAILAGYFERRGLNTDQERARRSKQKKSPTKKQRSKSPEDRT
jgi:hypothetical protein